MKISEIHVGDFGAWHDLTLEQLSPGVTVFYGPNEAGKTTLLNWIRTALYGFSGSRCERYLPPAEGQRASGWLRVEDVNGQFEIARSAAKQYPGGPGQLRIRHDCQGSLDDVGGDVLTTLLAGVNETIFNNVFAVGLTQMQQLATLSDTEAANQLYGLATGVDRVSLYEVTRELDQRRQAILPDQADIRGEIDELIEARERLKKERKALRRDAGHFSQLRKDHLELRQRIQKREVAQEEIDLGGDWSATSKTLRQHWLDCVRLQQELATLGPIPELPPAMVERVLASRKQLAEHREQWLAVRTQRRELRSQADQLKGADALYKYAAEIEAFQRQRPRLVTMQREAREQQARVEELEFELQAELEELGLQTGVSAKSLPAVSDEIIEALRQPARDTRELRQVVESYQELEKQQQSELEKVSEQLEVASRRFGGEGIEQALHRSAALVHNLERRLNLDEEQEELGRELEALTSDVDYWRERTVLPWRGVLAMCGLFALGAMLLVAGGFHTLFGLSETFRIPLLTIGGSLAVISLIVKVSLEYSAYEKVRLCEQQRDQREQELADAREEVASLEETLAGGKGHLDQRLADARQELAQLDQFAPLQQREHELRREVKALQQQASATIRQLKDARRVWKASLRAVCLPDSLTPAQISKMSGKVAEITHLRQRMQDTIRINEERSAELGVLRDRLQGLLAEAGIHEVFDTVEEQLDRLIKELSSHQTAGKQRAEFRAHWEALGQKQRQLAAMARQLLQKRLELLRTHGLESHREFQESLVKTKRSAAMRRERNAKLAEIQEHLGEEYSVQRLIKQLAPGERTLLDHLESRDEQKSSLSAALAADYERLGEMKQKLDSYMTDRRVEKKDLELNAIEERLRAATERWRQAAFTSAVLDRIKSTYETKRQPVALAEASRHLERLTEGRYVRVWTPMGQDALCVDDQEGQSLSVGKLSRGTRELVYLALRLALVSSYHRRGANMPIVLDDVFVNFDDQRARVAAEVLADVAAGGQQLLIFTCHQRIQAIFRELECDVRELPRRGEQAVASTHVAPLPKPTPPVEAEPVVLAVPTPEPEPEPEPIPAEPVPAVAAEINDELWIEAQEELEVEILELPLEPPPVRVVHDDQFHPAWRDENLRPLPDLVADDRW